MKTVRSRPDSDAGGGPVSWSATAAPGAATAPTAPRRSAPARSARRRSPARARTAGHHALAAPHVRPRLLTAVIDARRNDPRARVLGLNDLYYEVLLRQARDRDSRDVV